ncbi:hypothetical protein TRFO_17650 [Tritrichomonas foetus]|uniref:GAF domain-containing protein n=1 Tax=Tritrichomonas foetus TaxID=1144522 RepID=A0A1J4KMN5_9EUKA|nr:hypothetical protein TRFO_17650 [Tritrichomonas foetus]|eukprot:OHT12491.1 hypothetical protein TRFO_17650 [Tritrichomonas foetus]
MKKSRPSTQIRSLVSSKHISTPKSPKRNYERSNQNSPFTSSFKNRVRTAATPTAYNRFSINERNETIVQTPSYNFSPSGYIDHSPKKSDESDQLFLSFDLLKTMTPKNCIRYLNRTPLFLKTMVTEGHLDPDIISSVSLSLTQNELQAFIQNMTNELNIFSSIHLCETILDAESRIMNLIPLTRVTIWNKSDYADYIYSPSLKTVLMLGKSIVCYPFIDKQDLITADPGDHKGFIIDQDLPLLRATKSMMLLPIFWPNGEIASIIQCVGFKDTITDTQAEFTNYYIESIKIIRDILQKKFYSKLPDKVVPSNVTTIFGELEKCSLLATVTQISKYLQNGMPCETVDLFEFDDRAKILTRLNDNTTYNEETGGISYQAAISTTPINLSHGTACEKLTAEIDTRLSNRSVFSISLFYHRQYFVITLRAKPNAPAFNAQDTQLMVALTPLICDSLKLSKWLEKQAADVVKVKEEMKLMTVVNETLAAVNSNGCDRWVAIKSAAAQFFECESLFLAIFDGRYMKFTPTDYKCKFEECTAGTAYNFREPVWGKPENEKSKFNKAVYEELKVNCEYSLAFPYRTGGRVAGAIELINPKQSDISLEKQKIFSNLVSCLLSQQE